MYSHTLTKRIPTRGSTPNDAHSKVGAQVIDVQSERASAVASHQLHVIEHRINVDIPNTIPSQHYEAYKTTV